MRLALALALLALGGGASAHVLEVDTEVSQGGLGRGSTELDARVALDGRPIRVAPDGRFIFGFGRDAKPEAALEVVFPDGERLHRGIHVAQRTYDVRRIDGLPEATINCRSP